jgi:hypothetical protein
MKSEQFLAVLVFLTMRFSGQKYSERDLVMKIKDLDDACNNANQHRLSSKVLPGLR